MMRGKQPWEEWEDRFLGRGPKMFNAEMMVLRTEKMPGCLGYSKQRRKWCEMRLEW